MLDPGNTAGTPGQDGSIFPPLQFIPIAWTVPSRVCTNLRCPACSPWRWPAPGGGSPPSPSASSCSHSSPGIRCSLCSSSSRSHRPPARQQLVFQAFQCDCGGQREALTAVPQQAGPCVFSLHSGAWDDRRVGPASQEHEDSLFYQNHS